jgi:hypothetical protein
VPGQFVAGTLGGVRESTAPAVRQLTVPLRLTVWLPIVRWRTVMGGIELAHDIEMKAAAAAPGGRRPQPNRRWVACRVGTGDRWRHRRSA